MTGTTQGTVGHHDVIEYLLQRDAVPILRSAPNSGIQPQEDLAVSQYSAVLLELSGAKHARSSTNVSNSTQ